MEVRIEATDVLLEELIHTIQLGDVTISPAWCRFLTRCTISGSV